MRIIPKFVVLNLLDGYKVKACELNVLIYLYTLADKYGQVYRDYLDIEEMKKNTHLSEISIKRALASLFKRKFITRNSSSRRIVNDFKYSLIGYNILDNGYIELSSFLSGDFMSLPIAAKRLALRILIAENIKHTLRLTFDTLYKWSGVNRRSRHVLISTLNELIPYFDFKIIKGKKGKPIIYFKKAIGHNSVSVDENETFKMNIQLKKVGVTATPMQIIDFIKNKMKFGIRIFSVAIRSLANSDGIRNICAYLNYLSKKISSERKFIRYI